MHPNFEPALVEPGGDLVDEILRRVGDVAPRFTLTGGAALAGFHLGHRDVGVGVPEPRLELGEREVAVP